jgi:hypothetical protein
MSNKQIIGLIGIVLIIMGLFIPLARVAVPIKGWINFSFFDSNKMESIIVMGLCAISLMMILSKRKMLLWFSSIATFTITLIPAVQTILKLTSAKSTAEKIFGEKLTSKLADKLTDFAMGHVHVYWGLVFLMLGVILVFVCAILLGRTKKVSDNE